jgi:hypothetical protein
MVGVMAGLVMFTLWPLSPVTSDRFFTIGYSFRIDRFWGRVLP